MAPLAVDRLAQRRYFGGGFRLIRFRARGIACDVKRDDGCEFAGLGVVGHENFRLGKADCGSC